MLLTLLLLVACSPEGQGRGPGSDTGLVSVDTGQPTDTGTPDDTDTGEPPDTDPPQGCDFTYASDFGQRSRPAAMDLVDRPRAHAWDIAHAEPEPPFLWGLSLSGRRAEADLTMPGYDDDMPLFERAEEWAASEERCYQLPSGDTWLGQDEAFDLWVAVAEQTTGVSVDTAEGARTVVGLRGAYPGTFAWHGNTPDRFNDTLALIWTEGGERRVLEFPVNTDTGAVDFGYHSSSSLRPNRRYHYKDGWHRSYNALQQVESSYPVRDDANGNGHWDSERNGWLPPLDDEDHDRDGSAHNIHMASVDAPLGTALVQGWSAGCQTIPGMHNWTRFITSAWTDSGDAVDYHLVDARDIAPQAWGPCTPDGTVSCPYQVEVGQTVSGDTSTASQDLWDSYAAAPTVDESGAEVVYVLTLDDYGTLRASVDCEDPVVDVDVHLLEAADPVTAVSRGHWEATWGVGPGRWFVVVDTWSDGTTEFAGPYDLSIVLD